MPQGKAAKGALGPIRLEVFSIHYYLHVLCFSLFIMGRSNSSLLYAFVLCFYYLVIILFFHQLCPDVHYTFILHFICSRTCFLSLRLLNFFLLIWLILCNLYLRKPFLIIILYIIYLIYYIKGRSRDDRCRHLNI